jgi:hypothetical protein
VGCNSHGPGEQLLTTLSRGNLAKLHHLSQSSTGERWDRL